MFRYFIYNTYLRCNFHSRFHFGAVFVGPDGLMQPPFHIFTIVKHNVFLMTASSPFAFSPKEVLWPLRFPWYQKQVTKALEEKKAERATRTGLCTFFTFVGLHGGFLPMVALCFFIDGLCIKCKHEVAEVCRRVATAGFHVDSHSCFRVSNDNMRFTP